MRDHGHLAFFNRSYYPDQTATGQLLTELCEDLVAHHHWDVSVIAGPVLHPPASPSAIPQRFPLYREIHNGVRILRVFGTTFSRQTFFGRCCNYLSYVLFSVVGGVLISRPHLIVSQTDPPIIGLVAFALGRLYGSRYIYVCKDVFPEAGKLLEDFRSPLVYWLLERIQRFLLRHADRVVAIGETMKRRLLEKEKIPAENIVVIPDWADTKAIEPVEKENPFSKEHGLGDKFVVMHSGNMGLSQGLEILIECAESFRGMKDIRFVLVGDGVQRDTLVRLVASKGLHNVVFLPYQPKAQLRYSFSAADVFVISLKRGMAGYIVPSKLYGILASGRPYIAAVDQESEVAEITCRYGCGLLANPQDGKDLAEKILVLYRDRELAARMGRNGRRAAMAFDRGRAVSAYHELFHEVVRAKGSSPQHPVWVKKFWAKRCLDITLSAVGLIVSAPLWGLIALAIKLEDRGKVFYVQERVGRWGKIFLAYKFRSMVQDAESATGPVQSWENDTRVTRVGRILRVTAMDELPQLWNIFKGDMSFVGPRALRPGEIEVRGDGSLEPLEAVPGYRERQSALPGLTGVAQIYASRDLPRRQKFRYDLMYIRRQGLWLDLKLILTSFWITFRGRWESRTRKI
jgi:lipopolysaccharide/colanic/teichoic acid biosynthesis glycosyltransferase/glycosyltransferase involved in cell wall biosynthesis